MGTFESDSFIKTNPEMQKMLKDLQKAVQKKKQKKKQMKSKLKIWKDLGESK